MRFARASTAAVVRSSSFFSSKKKEKKMNCNFSLASNSICRNRKSVDRNWERGAHYERLPGISFFSVFFSEIVFVVFFLFFFFFYREFPPQAGGGARPAEHPRYFPFARYRRRRSVGCCCLFTWWWWFIYLFILRWGVFFSLFPFSSSSSSSSSPIGRSPDEDIPCRDRPLSKREPPIRCAVLRGLGIQIKNQKKNI